jgi:large subunit ribosomal protein L17
MRHLNSGRKLSRNSSHRWAMMRNMVTSLLREEKIQTTDPKAKELRRWTDRVITLGKEGSLHARRQALAIIQDKSVVHKLFETIATRFKNRAGGYTRIIKIGRRHGDAAPVSLIELLAGSDEASQPTTGQEKKAKKKSRKAAPKRASGRRKNAKEASA